MFFWVIHTVTVFQPQKAIENDFLRLNYIFFPVINKKILNPNPNPEPES